MKQLLWLGSFMDEATNQIMISQGYKNAASYVSQKNLLEGIETETGEVFDSVNAVAMTGYPRQGKKIMESREFSHAAGTKDVVVGYINLLYINKFFVKKSMVKAVKQWIKTRYKGDKLDVFVYEMRSACLDAAAQIKKEIPQARIHLIIPDLPCFMDLNMSRVKKVLKQIDWKQMIQRLDCVDDFLPYAETMVDYLGIKDRKWMVMEGSLNKADIEKIKTEIDKVKIKTTDKKVILYSGWIDQSFGIDQLIDAMEYLDDGYILWITGGGPYEAALKEKVKRNRKVTYYGFLPIREELFKLQAQASVMMNIRNPEVEAAHYCFPSKLFEYMLVGRPVLSVKLRGIPHEYRKYLFEFDKLEGKQIAEAVERVLSDENREKKAMAGRIFVEEKKNNLAMAKKIMEFINS